MVAREGGQGAKRRTTTPPLGAQCQNRLGGMFRLTVPRVLALSKLGDFSATFETTSDNLHK